MMGARYVLPAVSTGQVARILLCAAALLPFGACSTYETTAVRLAGFPHELPTAARAIGVGHFAYFGGGRSGPAQVQRNLRGSLAFGLRERGFQVAEASDVARVLERSELAKDRLLVQEELVRLSGRFGPRLLLQGEIHETITQDLVEDYVQLMVNVYVHDMRSGAKVCELRVFARNLPEYTGRESHHVARLVARELDTLLPRPVEARVKP